MVCLLCGILLLLASRLILLVRLILWLPRLVVARLIWLRLTLELFVLLLLVLLLLLLGFLPFLFLLFGILLRWRNLDLEMPAFALVGTRVVALVLSFEPVLDALSFLQHQCRAIRMLEFAQVHKVLI